MKDLLTFPLSPLMQKIVTKGTRENMALKAVMYESHCNDEDLSSDEIYRRMKVWLKDN